MQIGELIKGAAACAGVRSGCDSGRGCWLFVRLNGESKDGELLQAAGNFCLPKPCKEMCRQPEDMFSINHEYTSHTPHTHTHTTHTHHTHTYTSHTHTTHTYTSHTHIYITHTTHTYTSHTHIYITHTHHTHTHITHTTHTYTSHTHTTHTHTTHIQITHTVVHNAWTHFEMELVTSK